MGSIGISGLKTWEDVNRLQAARLRSGKTAGIGLNACAQAGERGGDPDPSCGIYAR